MMLRLFLFLSLLLLPVQGQATVLSDAVATCATLDSYCDLNAASASFAGAMPYNLTASDAGQATLNYTTPFAGIQDILEYADKGFWSQRDRKLIFRGAGHFQQPYWISYDEATNVWTKGEDGAFAGSDHSYSNGTVNPLLGRWYHKHGTSCTSIQRYSVSTNSRVSGDLSWSFNNSTCHSGSEYFPDIGEVVFFGLESGASYGLVGCIDSLSGSGTCTRIGSAGAYSLGADDAFGVYNPVHRVIVFAGSNQNVWKLDASKTMTQMANAPCALSHSPASEIFTVDPVSGDYILLCGTGTTYKFDVTNGSTGTWTNLGLSTPSFYETAGSGNGFFDVVAIPSRNHGGIFFLECGGASTCQRAGEKPRMWFFRHATQSTYDVKCANSGVVYCEDFSRAQDRLFYAPVTGGGTNCNSALSAAGLQVVSWTTNHSGVANTVASAVGGTCHWPTSQTTVKHVENGALELTTPSNANAADGSGFYETGIARRGDGTFFYATPSGTWGDVLWMQYYVRIDSGFASVTSNCSGGCYGWKLDMLCGNPPNGSCSSTIEITNTLYENGDSVGAVNTRTPTMYGQQGSDCSYYSTGGAAGCGTGGDNDPQPVVGCVDADGTGATCVRLSADTWYEFTVMVDVSPPARYAGSEGPGCGSSPQPTSLVRFWIDGVKVIDNPCASINYGAGDGDGLGMFTFTNYHTNQTSVSTQVKSWYTEMVLSTNAICMTGEECPGDSGSGGGSPSPGRFSPSLNLRLAEVDHVE